MTGMQAYCMLLVSYNEFANTDKAVLSVVHQFFQPHDLIDKNSSEFKEKAYIF